LRGLRGHLSCITLEHVAAISLIFCYRGVTALRAKNDFGGTQSELQSGDWTQVGPKIDVKTLILTSYELLIPWSRNSSYNAISLARLGWLCVVQHRIAGLSAAIGPKLDSSL
jgi:hypothetical protein